MIDGGSLRSDHSEYGVEVCPVSSTAERAFHCREIFDVFRFQFFHVFQSYAMNQDYVSR